MTLRKHARFLLVPALFAFLLCVTLGGTVLAQTAPPVETANPALAIEQTNKALKLVVEGNLPEAFDLRDLFEVDLADENAVQARIEQLKSELEAKQDAKPDKPDSVDALKTEQSKLRLAFLVQPAENRLKLLEAEKKRVQLALDQDTAANDRDAAEQAVAAAETARHKALEEAEAAESEAERSLAKERALVEKVKGQLATFRLTLTEQRSKENARSQAVLDMQLDFRRKIADPKLAPEIADALYDEIRQELRSGRNRFQTAMENQGQTGKAPVFEPRIDLDSPAYSKFTEQVDDLRKAESEIATDAAVLAQEEKADREDSLLSLAEVLKTNNDIRIELLPLLSRSKRSAELGLGRHGIQHLKFEIEQLKLTAEFNVRQSLIRAKELPGKASDIFALGTVGWTLLKLIALFWAAILVKKRSGGLLKKVRDRIRAKKIDWSVKNFYDRWLRLLAGIIPSVGLVVFLYLFFWIVGGKGQPEVQILRAVALAYAWYRVCYAIPHRYITQRVSSRRSEFPQELNDKILKSIRLAVRYGFFVALLLILASRTLGRGYLYQLVVRFSWIGAVPIAVILLRRWREEIAVAYLNGFPDGRLVNAVKRAQEKKRGLLAVAAALLFVTARSARLGTQDALSKFKHTRKVFAFLFWRQLEKQSETVGRPSEDLAALPEALRDSFAEEPVKPEHAIDHFPHLDQMREALALWKQDGVGTAVALVGETGMGRTSWLNELEKRDPLLNPVRSTIEKRADSEAEICRYVCELLDLPPMETARQVVRAARSGPKRILVLDHCENLVLRSVDGMKAYKAFSEIVGRTVPHLLWICSFSRYAWEYVESVLVTKSIFRSVYKLAPLEIETIERLIAKRMKHAGFEASYEDLIVERAEGAEFDSEILRTEERYRQLLWDYTEGIPRLVVHFWLRSLVMAQENKVKVRLFNAPSADELEELNEQSRFMLAALITHQNFTVREAAIVLNYSEQICDMILGFLCDKKFVEQQSGHYRVTSHWYRAVIRYLRRKHLLYS
jgi:hypothetical protein